MVGASKAPADLCDYSSPPCGGLRAASHADGFACRLLQVARDSRE
jgi:hypothetical protein